MPLLTLPKTVQDFSRYTSAPHCLDRYCQHRATRPKQHHHAMLSTRPMAPNIAPPRPLCVAHLRSAGPAGATSTQVAHRRGARSSRDTFVPCASATVQLSTRGLHATHATAWPPRHRREQGRAAASHAAHRCPTRRDSALHTQPPHAQIWANAVAPSRSRQPHQRPACLLHGPCATSMERRLSLSPPRVAATTRPRPPP
jgi:hypothetical protein